ncbi:MAG: DNA-binding response regulator, partial [Acidimicrobiaceae bacterium]|nr:DNA-binding response regulator [Acidimicrobiaceae bacterium]
MSTRILTVEDDERIRTAVRLALEEEGWDVKETASGEAALEAFT